MEEIEKQIVPLIKNNKQSVNQVFINHPDILFFSKITFYKYVDIGVLSITNSDLPKKSRSKKRKSTKNKENKREISLLKDRKYEDLKLSNLFYCHPYSSSEKHGIEVNHKYIRRIFPIKYSVFTGTLNLIQSQSQSILY